MVYMRMGDQYKVEHRRRDRQLLIFKKILALLHAAVDKTLLVAGLYESTASRYLMGGAEKRDLHFLLLRARASSRRQSRRWARAW